MKYNYKKLKSVEYKTISMSGCHTNLFLLDGDKIKVICDGVELQELPYDYRADIFRDIIESAKIETWDKEYHLPPDKFIHDGLQWEVELEFEDGKIINSYGENAYPVNWLDVHNYLDKFYIEDEDKWLKKLEFKYIRPLNNDNKVIEELIIDKDEGLISLKVNSYGIDGEINISIKSKRESEKLLNSIFDVGEKLEKNVDSITNTTYELKVYYVDNTEDYFSGKYSRLELPEYWYDNLETLRNYFNNTFDLEFLKDNNIENTLFEDEVIYLSVSFDEYSEQTYYYQTTDTSIQIGDEVVVPVGKDNHESLAYVEGIQICDKNDVPLPLNKTKSIIRKYQD